MVIHEVNVKGVAVLEAKNNPPVRAYSHRPPARHLSLQRMKVEGWLAQAFDRGGGMQHAQYLPDLVNVLRVDTPLQGPCPARMAPAFDDICISPNVYQYESDDF